MAQAVVVIVVLFLALAAGVAMYLVKRSEVAPPPSATEAVEGRSPGRERREALEQRGEELLQRRVELDPRRGPLGGQQEIVDQFEELEAQLRAGTISENEFERAKIRLLGGEID